MREIFIASLFTCGTIVAWVVTAAAVRMFGQYAIRRESRPVIVTGNTVTLANASETARPTLIAPAIIPGNPKTAEKAPAEDFAVQCGSCRSPILSKPIRSDVGEGGKARLVYKCEHCGQTVGVKA